MATDYQSNSKKSKEQAEAKTEGKESEKNLEKIVKNPVIVKKRSLGRRFKDLITQADLKGAALYVLTQRMVPHVRDMLFDAGDVWWRRVVYRGERDPRGGIPGSGYRVQYNNPISRRDYPPDPRYAPPVPQGPRTSQRNYQDDLILTSQEDAEAVLSHLKDAIDQYQVVSVFDLLELTGRPSSHTDQKWGWTSLVGTPIYPVREGFLLALPPAEPI